VNVPSTGNTIYFAIKDDIVAVRKVRQEFASLALSLATDPNASGRITSATVNGQTFTATGSATNGVRLQLLRWIIACLDNGGPISATTISRF